MKNALLIFIFGVIAQSVIAQDVIVKSDGGEISSKVKEIKENVIKYKNYDNLEGPLRNIKKSNVFMIIYENGKREKFVNATKSPDKELSEKQTKKEENKSSSKFDKKKGKFIDKRDGQEYKWVKIGDQIWMAENLNYGEMLGEFKKDPKDNNKIEKWCYENRKGNCEQYGGLYSWNEMMQHQPSQSGSEGSVQGVCPDGWHVPTDYEWQQLEISLGMTPKEANTLLYREKNKKVASKLLPNGSSGFKALMGGSATVGMFAKYKNIKKIATFWTATTAERFGDKKAWYRRIVKDESIITRMGYFKVYGANVRCVKDEK